MTIQEIAARLAELCKNDEYLKAQQELYADDAVSIEPYAMNGFEKETHGLANLNQKIQQFTDSIEEDFGTEVSEPIFAESSFAFTLIMDVKMKGQDRMKMAEICVYQVKDGKIVSEQFFF